MFTLIRSKRTAGEVPIQSLQEFRLAKIDTKLTHGESFKGVTGGILQDMDREKRSAEDVREVIKTAKLHESELSGISQVLRFAESTPQYDNLRLIELDQTLLSAIEAGNQLVFKGEDNENIVLCTDSKTYDVKETETSNSLLLIPNLLFAASTSDNVNTSNNNSMESENSFDKSNNSFNKSTDSDDANRPLRKIEEKEIVKTFFTYYELKPCKPRLSKLLKLLEATRYRGSEHEYAVDKTLLVDYNKLFDKIQASHKELKQALVDIQALEIDRYYRLLEFDFEFRVLSYMLDLIDENSWDLDHIAKEVTLESLKGLVAKEVLDGMFGFYTEVSAVEDGVTYYRYKEEKVCRFLARVLLKSAGKFNLAEFMQAWKDSVPEGMVADEKMLSGIALTDKTSVPQVIWGFPESELPEDIEQRFNILFHTRPKWSVEQIQPYIQCYATEKVNVNAILTKYARASTQDAVRVFSSKHTK